MRISDSGRRESERGPLALAFQNAERAAGRKRPGYVKLCARLPALKAQHSWLCEPPAQALQQALKDLVKAWDAKFTSRFGSPWFKKRGEGDTVRFPQDCVYDAAAGTLRLPKLGAVRLRHSRVAEGKLKNVTLRMEGSRWVASLQTEREVEVGLPASTSSVGLDFGAATTIMPSHGAPIELPQRLAKYERRVKRLQKAVSRKKKGSVNRKKAVARLGACHARVAHIRSDTLHQGTTHLARSNALIAIENLAVKSMTASAAGTLAAPGKNVAAKSGLNRVILRNGWGMDRQMLEYKTAWRGGMLVAVPPAYTSQTCSACGHVDKNNRLSQARFQCLACGHAENADRNAAKNILAKANSILSGGCPANTAGYAGTHACEGAQLVSKETMRLPRPRSAAQGRSVRLPLAGTLSELSLSGNLHP